MLQRSWKNLLALAPARSLDGGCCSCAVTGNTPKFSVVNLKLASYPTGGPGTLIMSDVSDSKWCGTQTQIVTDFEFKFRHVSSVGVWLTMSHSCLRCLDQLLMFASPCSSLGNVIVLRTLAFYGPWYAASCLFVPALRAGKTGSSWSSCSESAFSVADGSPESGPLAIQWVISARAFLKFSSFVATQAPAHRTRSKIRKPMFL